MSVGGMHAQQASAQALAVRQAARTAAILPADLGENCDDGTAAGSARTRAHGNRACCTAWLVQQQQLGPHTGTLDRVHELNTARGSAAHVPRHTYRLCKKERAP
jgi:hypothetical protein